MKKKFGWLRSLMLSLVLVLAGILNLPVPAAANTSVQLSSLPAGSTVMFAGKQWVVLDPATGYLMMTAKIGEMDFDSGGTLRFDPSRPTNIAYYLNNTFYNSLPEADRAVIQTSTWTNADNNNEAASTVTCKIGLISRSEGWSYYHAIWDGGFNIYRIMTRTPVAMGYYDFGKTEGGVAGGTYIWIMKNYSEWGDYEGCSLPDISDDVYPALHVSATLYVSGGNGGVITPAQSVTVSDNRSARVFAGHPLQMSATVSPSGANPNVTWGLAYNTGYFEISPDGLLSTTYTGPDPYPVYVTAFSADGQMAGGAEMVYAYPFIPVSGLSISSTGGASSVLVGRTLQMIPVVSPANASIPDVTWSIDSDASNGAGISSSGLLTAGPDPGSVLIRATAADGSGVSWQATVNVLLDPAVVTGVSPAGGPVRGGTPVTITGSGFSRADSVNFGSTPAPGFIINSDTSITVISPAHEVGTVDVTVSNPSGTSAAIAGDRFTYSDGQPALWFKLGEGTGTAATDSSGAGYTGTITNPVWSSSHPASTDIIGASLDFSGGSTRFSAPVPNILTQNVSISAWVKWNGAGGYNNQPIAHNGDPAKDGYGLFLSPGGSLLVLCGGLAWLDTGTVLTPNVWQHVAAAQDDAGKWTVYLNGSQVSQVNGAPLAPSGHMLIGYTSNTAFTSSFPGLINNVRLYATTLTNAQVQQLAAIVPAVTGISPGSGLIGGGAAVTITGSGFTGVTGVSFGGTPAVSFTVNSDTAMTAVSPAHGLGAVDVTVSTAYAASAPGPAGRFTYIPAVTGVSPAGGPVSGGTPVTVSGSGFSGAGAVNFGNTPAVSFTINSDTSLTAVSPAQGAGRVDVTVTNQGATSAGGSGSQFTYSVNQPAAWWKLGEGSGSAAADSSGYGYNGTLTNPVWSTDHAPSSDSGTASLDFSGGSSGFTAPLPTVATANVGITAWVKWNGTTGGSANQPIAHNGDPGHNGYGLFLSPGGRLLLLCGGVAWLDTGINLTPNVWQHVAATEDASGKWFVYLNASQDYTRSTVPVTPSGHMLIGFTSNDAFTAFFPGLIDNVRFYTTTPTAAQIQALAAQLPVVTGISPGSGPTGGGTTVTITGSGFTGTSWVNGVSFGGTPTENFNVIDDTSITVISPAHGLGTVDVTVSTAYAASAPVAAGRFTYTPAVTGISPSAGPIAGGTLVTIHGSGFDDYEHSYSPVIRFGDAASPGWAVMSDTEILSLIPPHPAGTVDITVSIGGITSPIGAGSKFTYSDSQPAALWKLDEGTGTSAADSSVFGYHGTVTNPVRSADHAPSIGPGGASLDFSGGNSGFTAPLPTVATGKVSISAWVKWNGAARDGQIIVYSGNTGSSGYGLLLGADGTPMVLCGGVAFVGGAAKLTPNVWQQVTAVLDAAGNWTIYLNGSPAGTGVARPHEPWPDLEELVMIGRTGSTDYFSGLINDVRIYSTALTQEQVWELVGPVLPAVTGISPVSGPAGGGTAVIIVGSGFTGATGVSFGSAAAESFTVNSDTSITAVSPAGSGTVEVNVIKPSGTSSPAVQFTYLSASAGSISGTISEGANPIAGAQITLTVSGQPYSAASDLNGDYTILNVPAGAGYTVTAGKAGYHNGSAGNIQVTAGETTSGVNISLAASGPGNALAFDGTDDYVTMGDNDGSISALTIETWVKWDPSSAGDIQFICGKGIEQMEIHTGAGGANGLRFIPAPGVYLDAANALPTGIWTHLAFVYDPANSLAKMYINGNETALINNGSNPLTTPIGNTNTAFHLGNRSNGSYYFKGLLDDFRIWNRVRSPQEIFDDMTGALDVSVQTGLLSYYNFNQGTAGSDNSGLTNLPDLTGNYRGTLNHFALSGSTSNWLASDAWAGYEKTYTVSYDSNGGTGTVPTDNLNYVEGAQATVKGQGQLAKTGSAFAGWNTAADGSGTSYAAGAELTVTGNTTLYARWLGEHHAVTVSANSAAAGAVTGGGTYIKGASVTVTATPNGGYTFVNWTEGGSTVSTGAAFTFTLDTSDRTLVANFIVTPPDITTGTITGTVTDGTNPIAEANVSLTVNGSAYSAPTAADGSYSILNVPAGTGYTVTASKAGYTTGSAINVSVTANTTASGLNIILTSDQEGCLVIYKGAQKRYHAGSNTYDIRFIAVIHTLNAKEVGFVFSKSQALPTRENSTVKATTTVYTSITAAGSTVTAESLGGPGAYIIACTVTGIPVSDVAVPLHVRAFSTVGTVTKYTAAATVTVNSLP